MKRLSEVMGRDPNSDEAQVVADVVEIAQAWQRGELDLRGVRSACSSYERWQAMRFTGLESAERAAVKALVEALVMADKAVFSTEHGLIGMDEVYEGNTKIVTNWAGRRVVVWPMFSMEGQASYPRVDLKPGEERRAKEEAAMKAYKAYRDEKRKRQQEGRRER